MQLPYTYLDCNVYLASMLYTVQLKGNVTIAHKLCLTNESSARICWVNLLLQKNNLKICYALLYHSAQYSK